MSHNFTVDSTPLTHDILTVLTLALSAFRPDNVKVVVEKDTSFLQITARSEAMHEGFAYTSGRVHTRNHPIAGRIMPPKNSDRTWVDGGAVRVEAKLKLPEGTPSGTWPAFWMLPSDKVRD
jgi:hypothetical protein